MRNKIQLSLFLTLLIIGVQGKFAFVHASPTFDFSYSGVCVKSPTLFNVDYVLPDINEITDWDWNFGDGLYSTFQNPSHTYMGVGTFPVTLTITDIYGDISTVSHTITIKDLPVAFFSFDTPDCLNNSIQFTDLSNPTDGYIQQWIWDFNDGSPAVTVISPADPNVKHIFPVTGTFNVSLTVINSVNSCVNTIAIPVTVLPGPLANFHFAGKCEDQAVNFTDASSANGAGNIVAWSWNFGDNTSGIDNTSNLQDPYHEFKNPGTYNVTLQVTNFNGCTNTISKQIVINPHPPVEYTQSTICLGEPIYFDPDPAITNLPLIASWYWDFGDGVTSNAANTSHIFSAAGDYPVKLKVTDILGCKNEVTHVQKVNLLPIAHFSTNLSYCAVADVQFNDLSVTSAWYINSWEWNFGDGHTVTVNHPGNPNVSHAYAIAGKYTVTLTVKSSEGCTGTGSHMVIIHSKPVADFSFTKACVGSAVDFADQTQLNGSGVIMQWQWDFDDPGSGYLHVSSLQDPEHSFVATGNPLVQLIVVTSNGCSDTVTKTVSVNTPPAVGFTTTNNCQNSAVSFIPEATVMNTGAVASWYWDFGGSTSSVIMNPTHTFTVAGSQNVTLTIVDTSGCTSTITKPLLIAPEPVVNFSFPQPSCLQSTVKFDNMSTVPGGGFIVSSEWDFGDGNTQTLSNLASVTHYYSTYGSFNVKLTITTNNGCKKTLSLPLIILPKPLADFSVQSTCVNTPAQFTDLSQPGAGVITTWSWTFGEPATGTSNVSSLKSPVHTYLTAGTYPVTLIVSNSGGCLDTIIKQIVVNGLPVVDFSFNLGCVKAATQFMSSPYVNAGAIVAYHWDFGDGYVSTTADPAHAVCGS